MRPDRGSRRRVLIGILVAVLLIALFGLAIYLIEKHGLLDEQFGDSGDWGKNGAEQFSLELNDREYVSSDDIDAYLVIGKDDPKEGEQGYNGEMADFLMLILIDNTTQKYGFYQINRDTITYVDVLDENGNSKAALTQQICIAHWYGLDPEMRNANTVSAARNLFGGLPIDGYYTISMSDMGLINNAIGGVYNTYVTHFDASGTPTITDLNGIAVHSPDYGNYYTNAYATIDPKSNDLIIAYLQKDAGSQTQHRVFVNRITETGEKPWGDGILVADYTGRSYSDIHVDAIDAVDGFVVTYGTSQGSIEAVGYDNEGNLQWNTTMSSTGYNKTISENTSGYYEGQNIVAWVNGDDGGVYGQNIGWDGALGEVSPLPQPPVPCCYAPENFEGNYLYNEETASYGAMLTWEAPAYSVLHYNLYRENLDDGTTDIIEIDAEATSYFDETTPSTYKYQLTAMYDDFESEFAQTPDGLDYIIIEVTSVPENEIDTEIVTLLKIYSASGQIIRNANFGELTSGVYIIQGLNSTGKLVTKKVVLNNEQKVF